MKKTILVIFGLIFFSSLSAQKYVTKNGSIHFFSETPVELIEANNNQVQSALDISTGDFIFQILIKSFEFEKALMQEHFNENYLESDQFPNATLVAKVDNITEIDFNKPGEYKAIIKGEMTIHGVSKEIMEEGIFTINKDKSIDGDAVIFVKPKDYNIDIPGAVVKKIAESLEVTVDITLSPLD